MQELVPDIDSNIPLPASVTEAMPELSPKEELEMRARTVKLISDLSGKPVEPEQKHKDQAKDLVQTLVAQPQNAVNLASYPNETVAYPAGMVAQHDVMVVKELADLKKYVVNKLVAETEHPDAKIRLTALRALGEVDGVDAFKKRSEVTHKQQSIEEVEKELLETLAKLEKRTIDVEVVEIKHEDNATAD